MTEGLQLADSQRVIELRTRLVLVDGSRAQHAVVASLLGDGYALDAFDDAATAWASIQAAPPEAILSCLDLPGPSGLELLRRVKQHPELRRIPFIVTADQADAALSSLEEGADDFLPKPFRQNELRARVRAAVRSNRTYRELEAQHAELRWVHTLLSANEARTRAIFETAHEAILLLSLAGEVEEMNPSGERMFRYDSRAFHGSVVQLVAASARPALEADLYSAAAGCAPAIRELVTVSSLGVTFPAEWRVAQLHTPAGPSLCAFVRDLTEARRLELELHQAQKLEAVGRLAAGIAHEINTPIQFIGDNTRFLEDAFATLAAHVHRQGHALEQAAPEARAELEAAAADADLPYVLDQVPATIGRTLEGVERVATIVRAMKEFAHPDQKEMVATDLNRALQATLDVARNEYKYVADVETDLGELPLVACHAGDVNQVFLNLLVNAAHAIADVVKGTSARGRISVRTRSDGRTAEVAISDTGGGIPEEIRGKIYEPFFTTKQVGRGTGQGLAIARNVVEKHGGSIAFQTETGRGTTFLVRLPVDGPQPAVQARPRG